MRIAAFISLFLLFAGELSATNLSVENTLQNHVKYLTSNELQGRLTGSAGEQLATQYIATLFKDLKLEPAGDNGTYFQEFNFTAGVLLGKNNLLSVTNQQGITKNLIVNQDWRPLTFSDNTVFANSELVFAGYGITAPAIGKLPAYNSYKNLNVKNKWVVVLRYAPEKITAERRRQLSLYSSLRYKAFTAQQNGAKGIIFLSNELIPLSFDGALASSGIIALSVKDSVFPVVNGIKISGQTEINKITKHGRNVLAILKINPYLASMIVIGAHVDHLGHGELSGSLARNDEIGMMHPGADDNASGVASLLQTAAMLSELKANGKLQGNKNILLAAWSGEELGNLGSAQFVKRFMKITLNNSLRPAIDAAINLDMIGHFDKKLVVQGIGSSSDWVKLFKKVNANYQLPFITQNDPYLPTDSTAFYLQGVPALNFFTGAHEGYHSPRDTADTLNYKGIKNISEFLMGLIFALEESPNLMSYQEVKKTHAVPEREFKIYLGTIPDYTSADIVGVKLAGVAKDSPAAQAGIKRNDVIIELAGNSIHDIYDYTFVLNGLPVAEPVKLVVLRGQARVALTIVPRYRG